MSPTHLTRPDCQRIRLLRRLLIPILLWGVSAAAADNNLDKQLLAATDAGDTAKAAQLLANGADVNAKGSYGSSPLVNAALAKNADMLALILSHHPDLYAEDNFGQLPAWHLVGYPTLLAQILDAGMDPNHPNSKGQTLLMTAAEEGPPDAIKLLLKHGAKVNAKDNKGHTAAWMATANRRHGTAIFQQLMTAGSDLDIHDKQGNTLLTAAADNGNLSLFERLLQRGAQPWTLNAKGESALIKTIGGGGKDRQQIAGQLLALDPPQQQLQLALQRAITSQEPWMLEKILDAGAIVGDPELLSSAIDSGSVPTVRMMLARGWQLDVDAQQADQWLQTAVDADSEASMLRFLLSAGLTPSDATALTLYAIQSERTEAAKYLIANGATLPDTIYGEPLQDYLNYATPDLIEFIKDSDAQQAYRLAKPGEDPWAKLETQIIGRWGYSGIADITMVLAKDGAMSETLNIFGSKKTRIGHWSRERDRLQQDFEDGQKRNWTLLRLQGDNTLVIDTGNEQRSYQRVDGPAEVDVPAVKKPARLGPVGEQLTEQQAVALMVETACIDNQYKDDTAAKEKAFQEFMDGSGITRSDTLLKKLEPFKNDQGFKERNIFNIIQGISNCAMH